LPLYVGEGDIIDLDKILVLNSELLRGYSALAFTLFSSMAE